MSLRQHDAGFYLARAALRDESGDVISSDELVAPVLLDETLETSFSGSGQLSAGVYELELIAMHSAEYGTMFDIGGLGRCSSTFSLTLLPMPATPLVLGLTSALLRRRR